MPLYAYLCPQCGHRQDELQRYEDPAPACEKCGSETERQLSAPAIHMGEHAAVPKTRKLPGTKGTQGPYAKDVYDGLQEAAQKGSDHAAEYADRHGGAAAQVSPNFGKD